MPSKTRYRRNDRCDGKTRKKAYAAPGYLTEGNEYSKLKKEVLDRILWRTRFGKSYGRVVRHTTELMNFCLILRQNQKFNSAEGRFIRECNLTRVSKKKVVVCSRRNTGFFLERMRKTTIVTEKIARSSSEIQTQQYLSKILRYFIHTSLPG